MQVMTTLLADKFAACGWRVEQQETSLRAEKSAIVAKWFLGSRKVTQRIAINLNDARRELVLEETATETTIGIPPPSLIRAQWKQQVTQYTEDRTDLCWGGGKLHYGQARQLTEDLCQREGWTFKSAL
jgi:hypothetical protein